MVRLTRGGGGPVLHGQGSDARQSNEDAGQSWLPEDVTLRALVGGVVVGTLLCCTNLYLGLQSAFITMASMQAALVGFGLLRCVSAVKPGQTRKQQRRQRDHNYSAVDDGDDDDNDDSATEHNVRSWTQRALLPFTAQENAVLQATAVSLGAMPLCAGLIGIVPAFNLLSPRKDGENVHGFSLSWPMLLVWCASMAYFGIFFASPMRTPMIIQEKLRFPSGSATAQLIALLHGQPLRTDEETEREAAAAAAAAGISSSSSTPHSQSSLPSTERRPLLQRSNTEREQEEEVNNGWYGLLITFAASASITIVSFAVPVLYAIPAFDILLPCHDAASKWGWFVTPSLSYVGQGIIMGPQTTVSLFAGAVLGWAVLSPVVHYLGWTNGVPTDAEEGSQAWILWIALAIMTSESIVGLATLTFARASSHSSSAAERPATARDCEPARRLTPTSWIVAGLLGSTIMSSALLYWLFNNSDEAATAAGHLQVWIPTIGILLAGLLSVLAVRALGATDLNPVNALGKLSQLAFAFLQPGNIVVNMIGGALSEAGAMQAGELMQDYKTGHLLRASPRGQFFGQLVGSTVGVVVAATAYKLYERAYQLPGPEMPAPAARLWLNFARLINNGALPPHSGQAMIVAGIVFGLTTWIKSSTETTSTSTSATWRRVRTLARYLPNGIAFAVGLGLNTPNYSLARLCGGMVVLYVQRRRNEERKRQGRRVRSTSNSLPPVTLLIWSAGFVLGEGFASIILLLLKQVGAGPLTCWGCRGGCGGGC